MTKRRILHLISARGGGMERYARDLIALTPDYDHALLHISDDCAVLETNGVFYPLMLPFGLGSDPTAAPPNPTASHQPERLWDALNPDVIHAHFVSALALQLMEAAPPRPLILSLHDVGFLHPDAFAQGRAIPTKDPKWIARWREIALRSAKVLVPSRFILEIWEQTVPDVAAQVLEPGVATPILPDAPMRPLTTVGIVGAVGPHKGKDHLLELVQLPGAERFRWVLIGYTEDQLQPGALFDGRLWVHGPFDHADTARWLSHYAVDIVYFPNQIAESFSYALSDVWAAGVPAVVPDIGALGERMRTVGAGAVVPAGCEPTAAIAILGTLADSDRLSWHRALRDAAPVPDHASMAKAIAPVYRLAMDTSEALTEDLAALQPFLRSQLDGVVFRSENIRLARDYGQVREWAEKLEADVSRQQDELRALSEARVEVDAFAAQQTTQLQLALDRIAQLDSDVVALRARNDFIEASAQAIERDLHTQLARAESLTAEVHALAAVRIELETQRAALHSELERVGGELARMEQWRASMEQKFEQVEQARQRITTEHDALRINNAHLTLTVQQQLSALQRLQDEIESLRIKGARYDRVLGLVPGPLRRLLRRLASRSS